MGVMGIAEIMDRAVNIFKKRIGYFALFSLISGGIFIVLYYLITTPFSLLLLSFSEIWGLLLFIAVLFLILMIFAFSYAIGIMEIIRQDIFFNKLSIASAIASVFKNIPKTIAIVIINCILFFPLIAVYIFFLYYFDVVLSENIIIDLVTTDALYIIIFVILCLLGNIIFVAFMGFTLFCLFVVVEENCGIIDALNKALWLIKNEIFKILWSLTVIEMTVFSIYLSLISFSLIISGIIIAICMSFFKLNELMTTLLVLPLSLLNWSLSQITFLIIGILAIIMACLLCYNQKFKKEGYDIIIRLTQLENRKRSVKQ